MYVGLAFPKAAVRCPYNAVALGTLADTGNRTKKKQNKILYCTFINITLSEYYNAFCSLILKI